jgi:pimeloyl-ACP methyl ester carboxylesterase
MTLLKIVLLAPLAYMAIVAVIWAVQDRLLFPVEIAAAAGTPLAADVPRLELTTRDGATIVGVRLAPPTSPVVDRVIVLGFGGNAWNAEDAAVYLREIYPEADVVVFHYRGYAPSTGRASVQALLDDAPTIYDAIRETAHDARIVAVGFSIGSGIAVQLARDRKIDGLILVTPFDSLAALASDHFPWLPARRLIRHPMDSARMLTGLNVPTAIIAAQNDTVVPSLRTNELKPAAQRLVLNRTIGNAGHNDIYTRQEFTFAMKEALHRIQMTWN